MSKRLAKGKTYDWMVTVANGNVYQDYWGYVVGRDRTEDQELAVIKADCAAKMNVAVSTLTIRSAVFTERR